MTTATKNAHWGKWVKHRAHLVGFGRQNDLANAIGCGATHLCRWMAMAVPPNMRKGFDARLATALKTDPAVLFGGYTKIAPDAAPILNTETPIAGDEPSLRRKVLAIVELLDPDQLGQLHDKGRELLTATSAA